MKSLIFLLIVLFWATPLIAGPRLHGTVLADSDTTLSVQQQQDLFIPPVKGKTYQEGLLMGRKAGEHYSKDWPVASLTGLVGGILSGPLLPALSWAMAKGDNNPPMTYLISDMYKDKGVIFQTAFLEGFEQRTKEKKRRSIIYGGLAGMIIGVVVWNAILPEPSDPDYRY